MHAFFSILAHATPVALALAIVAALFAALRPARVEAAPAVAAPVPKPAPAEAPAVAHGGHAKGHNLDLFGGWPEGDVAPTPAEVKAQVHRVLKIRLSDEQHERVLTKAQAQLKLPGAYVRDLLLQQIGADEPMADQTVPSMADTLA
jgi:hypothetical protein